MANVVVSFFRPKLVSAKFLLPGLIAWVLLSSSCGSGGGTSTPSVPTPQFSNVFVVMEENAGYQEVIGNPSMPYLNSLASRYGLATQYYGNAHPSIGNYFMLTTGQTVTNDDAFNGVVGADNLVRQFHKDAKTWRVYAESLPSQGYTGGDVYPYLKHHNPFAYFTDVSGNVPESAQIRPFAWFSGDLANRNLANFVFIIPNALHDAHDCPDGSTTCTESDKLAAADSWLQSNIAPLIASPNYQDALLVIVFDEAAPSDTTHGGGHVAAVLVSNRSKSGYQGSALYQHQNLLRTIGDALGLSSIPGQGASASSMGEFFQ